MIRLTPLNILVASLISYSIFSVWLKQDPPSSKHICHTLGIIGVLVVADLGCRRSASSIRRIWMMELAFISFTALTLLIISRM